MQAGEPWQAAGLVPHRAILPILRRERQVRTNFEEKSQMTAFTFRNIQIKALRHNLTKIIAGR